MPVLAELRRLGKLYGMCRSIKTLREGSSLLPPEEVEAAALQFVRKISGFRKPSPANEAVFDKAVAEISDAAQRLLDGLVIGGRVTNATKTPGAA